MTTTFEDLATIGIVDKPIDEVPTELIEFLQHYGIEPIENPSDQYLDDLNALMKHGGFVAHYGKKGMKWGERKIDLNKNGVDDSLEDGMTREELLAEYTVGQTLSEEEMKTAYAKGWEILLTKDGVYQIRTQPKHLAKKPETPTAKLKKPLSDPDAKRPDIQKMLSDAGANGPSGPFNPKAEAKTGRDYIETYDEDGKKVKSGSYRVVQHDGMGTGLVLQTLEDGTTLVHWGVLGMRWGRRKDRSGKYHETPNRMAGNHPGQGNVMEVSGVVKKEFGRPKVGGPIKTHEGRGTITEVTERKDGTFFVKVDVPDPGKVKGGNKTTAPEQPKADRPAQPSNQTDSPSTDSTPKPQGNQKSEYERRNDELAAIIRRIELEQKYAQLTATPKPKLLAATEKVLADAAKKTATDQATKAMGALVNMAVKKAAEAAEKNKKKS